MKEVDETEFQEWIAQAWALSLYELEMQMPKGANILTLSICDCFWYDASGRLIALTINRKGADQMISRPVFNTSRINGLSLLIADIG